jgi:UDP-glucuronate 4-epimerase
LFASSSSVYGNLGLKGPVKESDATGNNLQSYYAATKWSNEILAKSYATMSRVPTAALRFFTVYGEAGRPDMAYWTFLERLRSGAPIDLYGKTGGTRNFTYVKDAISILKKLILTELPEYSEFNIAAGEPIDTIDFANILARVSGHKLNLNVVDRPKIDVEKTWADLTNINSVVGPIRSTDIEIGLSNFYEWYTTHGIK